MKNLAHEPEGLSLFPQNPTQKRSAMVYSRHPRPGGMDAEGSIPDLPG